MSVMLFEDAIARLIETETGPVGQFVADKAQEVTLVAQEKVRLYFWTAPTMNVDEDVGFEMTNSTAEIGIHDRGEKSARMARYQAERKVNWLLEAAQAVFPLA